MKKMGKRLTLVEREEAEERLRETIRKNFDNGSGAEVLLGSNSDGSDKPATIHRFFSSKVPKLHIKSGNIGKTIDVEMSSVEEDNQSLLHYLFKKSEK